MSIYNKSIWLNSTTYNKWDVIKYNNLFYYSLQDVNLNQTPATVSNYWAGITTHLGRIKPSFVWRPSYNGNNNLEPKVKNITFGDGYSQKISDGINNILLNLELTFDLRSDAESEAINHFLFERKGSESFVFTPNIPYNIPKLFVCDNWSENLAFYDNHSIRCNFKETTV